MPRGLAERDSWQGWTQRFILCSTHRLPPFALETLRTDWRKSPAYLQIFDTLQERYEELSSELTDFNRDEKVAQAEIVRSENNASIQRLEILMEKVHIYSTGIVILEFLSALLDLETPSPVILSEFKTLKLQISEFRKDSLFYSSDGEISRLRGEISATMKNIFPQLRRSLKNPVNVMTLSLPMCIMKPIVQNSFKLTLDLPKFSGKPID